MPGRRKEIAAELVTEGRRLYENTLTPVRDIARVMGISRNTLDNRIAEWKWLRRYYVGDGVIAANEPQHATAATEGRRALPPVETSATLPVPAELPTNLAVRLQRAIDGHFDVIDRTLKVLTPSNSAEAERTTRTLAIISRTMHELTATANSAGPTPPDETDDDPVPRDMDAFRNELARRLHALIDARQPGQSGSGGRVSGEDAEQGS